MPKTYTVKQVAQALGFSTNTVYKYLEEGKIQATRLGPEGRFRIPESELTKFVGNPTPIQFPEPIIEVSPPKNTHLDVWYLTFTFLILAITLIIYPDQIIYLRNPITFALYPAAKYLLLISGLLLAAVPVIKHQSEKLIINLAFGLSSLVTFIIFISFFSVRDSLTAGYFLALSICCLFSVTPFSFVRPFPRFLIYLFFIISLPLLITGAYPFGLTLFAISGIALAVLVYYFSISRFPGLHLFLTVAAVLFNLSVSVFFLTIPCWPAAIIHLITGYFLIIFSFEKNFTEYSSFSPKQLWKRFARLIFVLVLGISLAGISQYILLSFYNFQSENTARSISGLTENLIRSSSRTLSIQSRNDELIKLLTASYRVPEKIIEKAKNFYFSSSAFRRVIISDPEGRILAIYPPLQITDSPPVGLSVQPGFQQTLTENRIIFSDGPSPVFSDTPFNAVLTSPVASEKGKVTGVISAALDLKNLENQIRSLNIRNTADVLLTNTRGQLIAGTSGTAGTIDSQPTLRFLSSVPVTGWQIEIRYLYRDLYTNIFLPSFLLINLTVFFAVATLLIPGTPDKKNYEVQPQN